MNAQKNASTSKFGQFLIPLKRVICGVNRLKNVQDEVRPLICVHNRVENLILIIYEKKYRKCLFLTILESL
jgi:hypothetical protein